jgi:ParB-like chromosome segregation protein Spo0J
MTRTNIGNIIIGRCLGGLDRKKITRYRQALRRGDIFPPILVMQYRRGRYEVFDGFHRYHAHRLEGRKTIEIFVIVK